MVHLNAHATRVEDVATIHAVISRAILGKTIHKPRRVIKEQQRAILYRRKAKERRIQAAWNGLVNYAQSDNENEELYTNEYTA